MSPEETFTHVVEGVCALTYDTSHVLSSEGEGEGETRSVISYGWSLFASLLLYKRRCYSFELGSILSFDFSLIQSLNLFWVSSMYYPRPENVGFCRRCGCACDRYAQRKCAMKGLVETSLRSFETAHFSIRTRFFSAAIWVYHKQIHDRMAVWYYMNDTVRDSSLCVLSLSHWQL